MLEGIHPMSCRISLSQARGSPPANIGLGLFLIVPGCTPIPIDDNGLPTEDRQLSMEQSPILACPFRYFSSRHPAAISDKEGSLSSGTAPIQSLLTLIASSESSCLASSSPTDATGCSFSALQAFSSMDCRYLLCASIRRWR